MTRSNLDVWTARLSKDITDHDLFWITRSSVAAHRPTIDWNAHGRDERMVRLVLELEANGVPLPDIQRRLRDGGAPALQEPWAPPFRILKPALDARAKATTLRSMGHADEGSKVEEAAWATYEPAYMTYLRATFLARAAIWRWLLGRGRVVLACPCQDVHRCHRGLAARALEACGATYRGEVARGGAEQLRLGLVVS